MNLGKSFSYVFEDEKWIETILIGGLITLIPILGQLYAGGFMVAAARRVVEGNSDLLPEWGEVGQKISDGFKFFVITFVYALPAIAIALLVGIPGGFLISLLDNGGQAANLSLILAICFATCFVPLLILLGIVLQVMSFAGLAMFVRSDKVGDALRFGEAYRMVSKNVGGYLILWLVQILAGIIAGLGSIFFGFGVLFTTVYAQALMGNYLGQFIQAAESRPELSNGCWSQLGSVIMTGETEPADVVRIVRAFNEALNGRDVEGMLRWLAPDSLFENTYPPPDGERVVGREAQRLFWEDFFQGSSQARIEIEEIFALGERCVMRWTYRWVDTAGQPGHVRGVDVYRVENGLILEKLSYVKG